MSTALLTRHPRLATNDLDEARAEVATSFCPHELTLTSACGRLDMVHNAASVASVGINYLRYGAEVRITPVTFETFYLVQIPLAGRARIKVGNRVIASDRGYASLPSPTEPVDMVWSADCEQLLVYLDRQAVEDLAATRGPGHPTSPVVFDPLVDLDAPAVRSWLRLVQLAREDVEQATGVLNTPLAGAHFEQVLISGLLSAQPNSTALAPAGTAPPTSRTVRRALDLVTARPEHPWRIAELATEVGTSARSLQEAFQRERGTSPLEELRRVRLVRVHADLTAADPGSTTVSEVACRWGFFHLGRFAQTYRAAYAEAPSHTLAR